MSDEGGEESPPRPKRKIKKVMVLSSSSGSDSDEGVGVAGTRRKRLRVISDNEASDSSGSSVVTRQRRKLPALRDSDAESDSSGWATDRSEAGGAAAGGAKAAGGFASDSSEGNSDKCSICLLRFTDQQIGTPESCEHIFCLDCITEWSKNVNTCPVDRATFNSIVVRACMGGRVLRTVPVTVVERPPSVEVLVVEDLTACEICGNTNNEETMLLCDGCDLGYHMNCLSPPLTEIPMNQWLCPSCIRVFNAVGISEVEDMLLMNFEISVGSRSNDPFGRNLQRALRNRSLEDQPSTSSGRRGNRSSLDEVPTTSRGSRPPRRNADSSVQRRATTAAPRRKRRRRKTKTVIIEYEVEENGKFPITKRVKRKIKRRKPKKRQTRTVARRTHVRASVRAKLASLRGETGAQAPRGAQALTGGPAAELRVRRQRAGIPALDLFGSHNQLDYFSDDENDVSEGATAAVAARPTSNILSAYRQARRKLITISSPPHATSAPDILSNILESQTLLHSKNSIVSVTVDGNVNIKLQNTRQGPPKKDTFISSKVGKVDKNKDESLERKPDGKIDLSKGEDAARQVPSYPSQSRGGGGWGGGYRGNYHREQNSNNFNNRGSNYDNNYNNTGGAGAGGGGYQARPGQAPAYGYQNNNMRREEPDSFGNYPRRPHQYSHNEDSYFDRNRRPASVDTNRGPNYSNPNHQRLNDQNHGRYSLGPTWQPYANTPAGAPAEASQSRHSFGGFENPLDMRMGQAPSIVSNSRETDMFSSAQAPRQEKPQSQPYQALPEPPAFNFDKTPDVEKSEDEKSDSGLVIDTEKYDPTEPTNDDESGDEDKLAAVPATVPAMPAVSAVPAVPAATVPSEPPPAHSAVQSILAGIDTSTMNVPPNILDSAVRQVLQEHRNLIVPSNVDSHRDKSDEDSDGDCPNFSIYSATSVHIANTSNLTDELANPPQTDNLEDLVQEDDETPPPEEASPEEPATPESNHSRNEDKKEVTPAKPISDVKKKTEEEYKEKISKRCPITSNTRNPIKIKLHTPSLLKKQVSLYDDDDTNEDDEIADKTESSAEVPEDAPKTDVKSPVKEQNATYDQDKHMKSPEHKEHKDETKHSSNKDKKVNEKKCDASNDKDLDRSDTPELQRTVLDSIKPIKSPEKSSDVKKIEKDHENTNAITPSPVYKDDDKDEKDISEPDKDDKMDNEVHSDEENYDVSETELCLKSPQENGVEEKDNVEKMTESISETEDERSYTPCLDENKSKDTSFETEKDKGLEGLDTEMISEEEGNEMFSENERPPSVASHASPKAPVADGEEGEIVDKRKEEVKKISDKEESKKKKKKESKKDGKDKSKNKRKTEISFKKLSKSGKERNYRERDKDKEEKKSKKERRESSETAEERQRRRREKRKDLERYDVRTVVTEKRKKMKDPFGRDISPAARSPSASRSPPALSPPSRRSPSLGRKSSSRPRRSPSPSRGRKSPSPARGHRSPSPSRLRRTPSRGRSPPRGALRKSPSTARGRRSPSSPAARSGTPHSPRRSPARKRRRTPSPRRRASPRRRRSAERGRKRRRSADRSPKPKPTKKKKRARSERPPSRRRAPKSPKRKRKRSASREPEPEQPRAPPEWSPGSVDSRLLSPRTPPPDLSPEPRRLRVVLANDDKRRRKEKRRRDPERRRRGREPGGPSKEVFTSGDNILVSVSFKDQERAEVGERRRRRETKRDRRKRRRAAADADTVKPVAIIDLDRSPFREITPSPKNVIVLSDSEQGDKPEAEAPAAAVPEPAPEPHAAGGPKTPPEPAAPAEGAREEERGPSTPPEPSSPDAYDPFEPTRSASASPAPAPSPPRALMTLETAQKTNMSADEVLDRRPLSPMEKVMALLQSTRDVSPEPPPGEPERAPEPAPAHAPPALPTAAAPPRIVLPEPSRAAPKLFLGKPSPIKSNPVKPMQALATKIARPPPVRREGSEAGDSPYSPGSSDFGDLFSPPPGAPKPPGQAKLSSFDALFDKPPKARKTKSSAAKVPVKLNKKKGKTQVGVKLDEDNLKILDDLPSSAVEMQVKSKFLKKLNRQERVVEEVKLVLKPHYNKKHVTKDEYKDILRRAVPKICHNKTGEINPTKIQALVEAYVKKFRKKHKLGLA